MSTTKRNYTHPPWELSHICIRFDLSTTSSCGWISSRWWTLGIFQMALRRSSSRSSVQASENICRERFVSCYVIQRSPGFNTTFKSFSFFLLDILCPKPRLPVNRFWCIFVVVFCPKVICSIWFNSVNLIFILFIH